MEVDRIAAVAAGRTDGRRRNRRLRGWMPAVITAPAAAALISILAVCPALAEKTERILRVGTSGDYAPFSTRVAPEGADEDAGPEAGVRYGGFDLEVARRFAGDHGYKIEIVPFRWPDLSRDMAAGRFDIAMGGVTVRGDRSVLGTFTIPVVMSHAVALAWKGAGINDASDLNRRGRRIAVNAGGYLEGVARKKFVLATVVALPNNRAVHMALMDRWTDAVLTDIFEEKAWSIAARDIVRFGPLSDDRKAYWVRADRADLAREMNLWLLARERDGTLGRMRRDKLGEGTHAAAAEPLAALASAIAERMAVSRMVWAAKDKARKPIEDKPQEARVLEAALQATAQAAQARSVPPPDPEQTRRVFKALIEAGKEVQNALEDQDKAVQRQLKAATDSARAAAAGAKTKAAAGEDARTQDEAARDAAPDDEATAAEQAGLGDGSGPLPESLGRRLLTTDPIPLFDLDTELRPSLARLTEKLVTLLVALDRPVTVEAVQSRLAAALVDYKIQPVRIGMMAEAIAAVAVSNAEAR